MRLVSVLALSRLPLTILNLTILFLCFYVFYFVVAPHRDTVTSNEWCPVVKMKRVITSGKPHMVECP